MYFFGDNKTLQFKAQTFLGFCTVFLQVFRKTCTYLFIQDSLRRSTSFSSFKILSIHTVCFGKNRNTQHLSIHPCSFLSDSLSYYCTFMSEHFMSSWTTWSVGKSAHSASLWIIPSCGEWSMHRPGLTRTLRGSIKDKTKSYMQMQ